MAKAQGLCGQSQCGCASLPYDESRNDHRLDAGNVSRETFSLVESPSPDAHALHRACSGSNVESERSPRLQNGHDHQEPGPCAFLPVSDLIPDFILEHLEDRHCDEIFSWYTSGDYPLYFRHFPPFLNKVQFIQTLCTQGEIIVAENGSDLIGFCALKVRPLIKACFFSMILSQKFQKKGIALHVMEKVVASIFSEVGCECVVVEIAGKDFRTQKLIEKFGFEYEATHKNACFYLGKLDDEYRYVLRRDGQKGDGHGRCC